MNRDDNKGRVQADGITVLARGYSVWYSRDRILITNALIIGIFRMIQCVSVNQYLHQNLSYKNKSYSTYPSLF